VAVTQSGLLNGACAVAAVCQVLTAHTLSCVALHQHQNQTQLRSHEVYFEPLKLLGVLCVIYGTTEPSIKLNGTNKNCQFPIRQFSCSVKMIVALRPSPLSLLQHSQCADGVLWGGTLLTLLGVEAWNLLTDCVTA
jgi:hypothetical protein